jgi:hypothetical protein
MSRYQILDKHTIIDRGETTVLYVYMFFFIIFGISHSFKLLQYLSNCYPKGAMFCPSIHLVQKQKWISMYVNLHYTM